MRDRVVVSVIADVDRLIGVDACDQIGFKRVGREREQAGFLFGEDFADRAGIVIGPGAPVSDAIAPFQSLAIEVLESGEAASGEEGIANIADGAFDPPLLIAASRAARPGVEMIMRAEFKQAWVKVNGVAAPLGDNTFQVVELMCPTTLCGQ